MFKPNYNKSILSVASSVLKHYGVKDCEHKTLEEFDALLNKNYKNVVVMLFDGLGVSAINEHLSEGSFLRKHLVTPISSVFPPTTTAATTTILTGLAPIEHAWLGWDLYFEELNENVTIFRNTLQRNGEKAADYIVTDRYIPYESIFQRIERCSGDVSTHFVSPFSPTHTVGDIRGICSTVKKICKKQGRKYIYTYCPEPDHTMHEFGVKDKRVKSLIRKINKKTEKLSKRLKDTLIVITADPGLIDSEWLYLEDYPTVMNMLKKPPSIESRALSLFVKDCEKDKFTSEWEKHFSKDFVLLDKKQVYEMKLFGDGVAHERADGFIGDYLSVAVGNVSMGYSRSDNNLIGMHAGATKDEMTIPFIAIECL